MGATASTETSAKATPRTSPPAVNAAAELEAKRLADKVTVVNTSLELSPDGKYLVAGQRDLKALTQALKAAGQTAEISSLVLTRGLSDPKDPNLQAAARTTLEVELNKSEYAGKIKLPSSADHSTAQNSADTSTQTSQKPAITETIKVNSNISSIGLYESGIQKVEIPSKEGQPPISVLHRAENQTFAHIVVSKVASDGKVTTTIAKVEQGIDLTKPIPGADVWTKSNEGKGELQGNGTGSVTLTEAQQKAVADVLKNLKQKPTPKPAEPEKPADEAGKAEEGGTSGKDAKPAEGSPSGDGQQTPPSADKGKPAPGSKPEKKSKIIADGRFDRAEWASMLAVLKVPDVVQMLEREYPGKVKGNENGNLVVEVDAGKEILINWKTGEATRRGNPSIQAVADFENVAHRILTGSHLPAAGRPRSLPGQNDFTVNNHFSEAERKALKRALENETFVKDLAKRLGYSITANDTYPRIQMSGPSSKRELTGVDIVTFNRETGEVDFTLGNKKPGPLSFLDGLTLSDRYALKPSTREEIIQANTVALKRVIISMLKK